MADGCADEWKAGKAAKLSESYSKGQTKCKIDPQRFFRFDGGMRKARWLAEWAGKQGKPAIYHCISGSPSGLLERLSPHLEEQVA
jgi:hypothetical protein